MSDVTITVSNFDYHFPPAVRRRYWNRVELCLTKIFQHSAELAKELRYRIEETPIRNQMLLYHEDSLRVAAFLAQTELTIAHLETYEKLLETLSETNEYFSAED